MPVLATVATKSGGCIARVKTWPNVEIVTVAIANRDRLPEELVGQVQVWCDVGSDLFSGRRRRVHVTGQPAAMPPSTTSLSRARHRRR